MRIGCDIGPSELLGVVMVRSWYPESWGAVGSWTGGGGPDFVELPLSLTVFPTVSKYVTGTSPRVPWSGLQASYQSESFSRPTTCRKSPCEKLR
jgi:hypothetical protein